MSKRLGYARQGVALVIGPIAPIDLPMSLGEQKATIKLLPVRVCESLPPVTTHASGEASTSIAVANPKPIPGTIHIELRQAQVRIEGDADPALVRILLECLTR